MWEISLLNKALKLLSVTFAMIASLLFSTENLGFFRKSSYTKDKKPWQQNRSRKQPSFFARLVIF